MLKRLCLSLALCGLVVFPAKAQQIGVAAGVTGSVSVARAAQRITPRSGTEMRLSDRVSTGGGAAMQILLLDESIFTVGENTELEITRYVFDPDAGAGAMTARLARGAFRFVSGRIPHRDPASVSLTTPSATIGSRGTSLDILTGAAAIAAARAAGLIPEGVTPDPATATLVVLRGPSTEYGGVGRRGRVIVNAGGQTLTINRPGYGAFVPALGAVPVGPGPLPSDAQNLVVAALSGDSPNGGSIDVDGLLRDSLPTGITMLESGPDGGEPGVSVDVDRLLDGLVDGATDPGPGCTYNCHGEYKPPQDPYPGGLVVAPN
ncbi:MAG: FecR domain-containing protein [Hyphomicrobiaceae bacterium]|nr:FecR domain-containing protein [Hyphomicrobiaceae bacterium]